VEVIAQWFFDNVTDTEIYPVTDPASPLRTPTDGELGALVAEVAEPTAMTLATVGPEGRPSARVVLLKGVEAGALLFYTNYQSRKGREIAAHPFVAGNPSKPRVLMPRAASTTALASALRAPLLSAARPPSASTRDRASHGTAVILIRSSTFHCSLLPSGNRRMIR
jgi:hypothetical protein